MNKQTTALIIAATVTLAAAMTTTAHADHDTGIYIQTGKGNFTYESDAAYDTVWDCRSIDVKGTVTQKVIDGLQRIDGVEYEQEEGLESIKPYFYTRTGELARVKIPPVGSTTIIVSSILDEIPKTEWINGAQMYTQTQACSNNKIDYNSIAEYTSDQKKINKWIEAGGEITSQQENLECLCKYWDTNTVKHEYAYTITDMPKDREIPPDYNSIVRAGVEAGLNSWAKINDIKFTYTDSRLEADIMIQQQIGAAYSNTYGNAEVGCIHENAQCTIQLFTDINTGNEQTLINKRMIEWVIAHEFGHLIGLPHHIDEGHIMSTIHATYVYSAPHAVRLRALLPTDECTNWLYLIDIRVWRLY